MRKILLPPGFLDVMGRAWREWGYLPLESKEDFAKLPAQAMREVLEAYCICGVGYVFTFDFHPDLAECCHRLKMYYVAWLADFPCSELWSKYARSGYSRIFAFDRSQYQMQRKRHIPHIWHLPLCTDVEGLRKAAGEGAGGGRKYGTDVSFVGNLYKDREHSLYDRISYFPPYIRGYLDALMEAQHSIWGRDLLWNGITESMWQQIRTYVKLDVRDTYEEGVFESMFVNMLGQKLAQMERMEVCTYLARHYDFALYTDSDTSFEPDIRNCGKVGYLSEMPQVFYNSKINIHITSRSIPSGISLRVLDVLACEGFLLTNYQPEIAEHFEDGKDLVMYEDFSDLYRKIDYYLVHEKERKAIAHTGYLKVKERFDYRQGIGKIAEILQAVDGRKGA